MRGVYSLSWEWRAGETGRPRIGKPFFQTPVFFFKIQILGATTQVGRYVGNGPQTQFLPFCRKKPR